MNTKSTLLIVYVIFSLCVCGWFAVAAASGWRAPNFGIVDETSSGRGYGGYWGGGK